MTSPDPPDRPVITLRRPEPHREMPRMNLKLTWDATTDVAYLVLHPTGPGDVLGPTLLLENDREFGGAVSADFTVADGRLVGLEFQMASACLPPAMLAAAERIDGEHLDRRIAERFERRARAMRTALNDPRHTH